MQEFSDARLGLVGVYREHDERLPRERLFETPHRRHLATAGLAPRGPKIYQDDFAFTSDSPIKRAFDARGLKPNVTLTATDANVIKTYVELGLGVGILASMAFDSVRDSALRAIDASQLFEPSTTRIGLRRNAYLRSYVYDFIELFAPHLNRAIVEKTMRGTGSYYEL